MRCAHQSCSFFVKRCSVSEYLDFLGSRVLRTAMVNCPKWLQPGHVAKQATTVKALFRIQVQPTPCVNSRPDSQLPFFTSQDRIITTTRLPGSSFS